MISKFFNIAFEKVISTSRGSMFFYHFVLKIGLNLNIVNFLTGKKIKNLAIICTNILAAKKLKKLSDKCKSIEDLVNLCRDYQFTLNKLPSFLHHIVRLKTFQNKPEIIDFLKLMKKLRPKVILEIGTAYGGTLYLISRFSRPDSLLISIDLPGGIHGGGYPSYKNPFYKTFIRKKQKITLLREDSHKSATLQKVKNLLKNNKVDILFIDGDHTYNGVKQDFEMYSPLVKESGIIGFHDIVKHNPEANVGVNIFWKEIKEKFRYMEYVEDWKQKWAGIGVLFKN